VGRPDLAAETVTMGRLNYGDGRVELVFDDRTLSHLQVAMVAKSRRRESFFLTWNEPSGERTSLWIDRSIPRHFTSTTRHEPHSIGRGETCWTEPERARSEWSSCPNRQRSKGEASASELLACGRQAPCTWTGPGSGDARAETFDSSCWLDNLGLASTPARAV
jgi:hypothetical protein